MWILYTLLAIDGRYRLPIRRENVNLVGFGVWVEKFPHDFLLFVYLEDFNFLWISLAVTANYGISVRESLSAARIRKVPTGVVVVANPGHGTAGHELCISRFAPLNQFQKFLGTCSSENGTINGFL